LAQNKVKNQFLARQEKPKFEKYTDFKSHLIHRITYVTEKMRYGEVRGHQTAKTAPKWHNDTAP